ncbi:unnamed protein product [Cryptosporidium hominis]|uniref:Uncharacterized protein n=2 Tax=Cryptosporidium hominis TaxID=237895 RepID=A0A0S4TEA6_CRYHO|nr:hypothetical protein ChTU502y2012_390g0085 [Cryptosporidium hominis]PPA62643.1 hypothetical protein ChUKH1_12255 [Cryptosporidium hominis]PPS94424.1 Uncharacterized protein GY17_00003502 [Cryptosporidium hominis]CUV04692.1 unnamed protein product [Cryptosporidium hominis]|eukprot:PPS94424.1 Uncharacterized protein GY17_00003502 [Cryptosporidium hominis]
MNDEKLIDRGECSEGFKFKFLDYLDGMSNDELMEIAMDHDNIMGLLEISLYPSEEIFKYSRLATELLCTNVFLDVLISGYTFGIDFNVNTNSDSVKDSELDFDLESDSDLGLNSESDSELDSDSGLVTDSEASSRFESNFSLKPNLNIETGSILGPNIQRNNNIYSKSNQGLNLEDNILVENRLDRIYAMPISVLIEFILDENVEYEEELGLESNMVGISNFSKLVYYMMIYDLEWTWKYILSTKNGVFLLNLIGLLNHPSIFHLLKLIIGILFCQDQDHELFIRGTEIKLDDILRRLCQNFRLDNELGDGRNLLSRRKNRDRPKLIKSTCEFLVDLFEGFLDLTQVFDHFNFEKINSEFTPLSMDTKLSRIMKYFREREKINIKLNIWNNNRYRGDKISLSDDLTYELLLSLSRSVQNLGLIFTNISSLNQQDLYLYSGLASGLMLVINTVVKLERGKEHAEKRLEEGNSNKKKDEKEKKGLFGVKPTKWMNDLGARILNLGNQVLNSESRKGILMSPIKICRGIDNKQVPNIISSRLKMINFEIIKIMQGCVWEIAIELSIKKEESSEVGRISNSSTYRGYLVSLIIEILDYIETLIDFEDIEFLRSLIEETTNRGGQNDQDSKRQIRGSSIVWGLLDAIIFQGRISNTVLEEKAFQIFKNCFDHCRREKKPTLGCTEKVNYSRSNKFTLDNITCTRKYFVLGYLKSSLFLSNIVKHKRETWIDDRILRRTITRVGRMSSPNLLRLDEISPITANIENTYDSNIKIGVSRIMTNRVQRSFSGTGDSVVSNHQRVSEYLYSEIKSMQRDQPWIANYF